MLFRLNDIYKSYATQDVLRGASLQVNPGEHVGLVGRNGAGKTTIFRLLNGEETPDRGDLVRARGVRLGLLSQHVNFEAGSTARSGAGSLCHPAVRTRDARAEHRMAEPGDDLIRY